MATIIQSYYDRPIEEVLHLEFRNEIIELRKYLESNLNIKAGPKCLVCIDHVNFYQDENVPFYLGILINNKIIIIRDVKLFISPLLFTSIQNPSSSKEWFAGIEGKKFDLVDAINFFTEQREVLVLRIGVMADCPWSDKYCGPLLRMNTFKDISSDYIKQDSIDEIGLSEIKFEGIKALRKAELPKWIKETTYLITGQDYYTKFSKTDFDCILFAQNENKYDNYAIQILRWFPNLKDEIPSILPGAYSFGYVSRKENKDLHNFMVENDCRILFGYVHNKHVTVVGGIESFINGALKKYKIPCFILPIIESV